jgi:hypothetical protein
MDRAPQTLTLTLTLTLALALALPRPQSTSPLDLVFVVFLWARDQHSVPSRYLVRHGAMQVTTVVKIKNPTRQIMVVQRVAF